MGTWLVRPEDQRRDHRWCFTDDAGAAALLVRWASKSRPFQYVKEEAPEIWIDGGGSVSGDEPKVHLEANGTRFGIFLRQIPFALEVARVAKENEKLPGCIAFGGWLHMYILSFATRDALVAELGAVLEREKETIQRREQEHAAAIASVPNTLYLGKCSCQSGKLYRECCGNPKRN